MTSRKEPFFDRNEARIYAQGVTDGMEATLQQILGVASDGGVAYDGPMPPELQAYCESALARLQNPNVLIERALDATREPADGTWQPT